MSSGKETLEGRSVAKYNFCTIHFEEKNKDDNSSVFYLHFFNQ